MTIIIHHHHIYKNAGTTIDWILNHNFPSLVLNIEGDTQGARLSAAQIEPTIQSYPEYWATSSHCTPLPHKGEQWAMFHITMLREPMERLYSMYRFDRSQTDDTPSNIVARNSNFSDYCQWWLNLKNSILPNWQTRCCTPQSWLKDNNQRVGWDADLKSASDAIGNIALCGIVERFDESMVLLEHYLHQAGIDFNAAYIPQNITKKESTTLGNEQQQIKELLGNSLYDQLLEVNSMDFKLLHKAQQKLSAEISDIDPNGDKLKEFQERCLNVYQSSEAKTVKIPGREHWIIVK